MRTREEILERKNHLKELYKKKRIKKEQRLMIVGGARELDWVLDEGEIK